MKAESKQNRRDSAFENKISEIQIQGENLLFLKKNHDKN
jgi:hypothetical protein